MKWPKVVKWPLLFLVNDRLHPIELPSSLEISQFLCLIIHKVMEF